MVRLLRLWRLGGRDLRLLWFAIKHPSRPCVVVARDYFARSVCHREPFNFAIPLLGFVGRSGHSSPGIACAVEVAAARYPRRLRWRRAGLT